MVPKTSVTPDLVESYMMEDSRKRRELLNKYVDKCTSHMVIYEPENFFFFFRMLIKSYALYIYVKLQYI